VGEGKAGDGVTLNPCPQCGGDCSPRRLTKSHHNYQWVVDCYQCDYISDVRTSKHEVIEMHNKKEIQHAES
jgi:hypothetical protein